MHKGWINSMIPSIGDFLAEASQELHTVLDSYDFLVPVGGSLLLVMVLPKISRAIHTFSRRRHLIRCKNIFLSKTYEKSLLGMSELEIQIAVLTYAAIRL